MQLAAHGFSVGFGPHTVCGSTYSHHCPLLRVLRGDPIDLSVAKRGHVEAPVGAGDDVGGDPEILAGDQTLALTLVELIVVVIDPIFQPGAAKGEVLPALVKREFEQVAAVEERPGGTYEQVPSVRRAEPAARKADSGRGHSPSPAELGVAIARARQDERPIQSLTRGVGKEQRGPAYLLQRRDKGGRINGAEGDVTGHRQVPLQGGERGLDGLELSDSPEWSHDLDPATVGASRDQIHLVEGVVAVLRLPEETGHRVEGE